VRPSRRALSRRLFLTGGAGVAAGAALAACARDDDHSYAIAGGDGPDFPNGVLHQFGSTRIQTRPERVVALGWGDADVLLALDVKPVAILDWLKAWPQGVGPWAQPKLGGTKPEILTGPEINFDAVATIAPDLVTFTKSDNVRATWQRLNKLAPTISGPPGTQPYGTNWKDQTIMIAGALARRADGDKLVADTEAAVAAAKIADPGGDRLHQLA
jgi:iron complex transport system substrate-binding protein